METCLIQLIVPTGVGKNISQWLAEDIIDFWTVELDDEHLQHNIVISNKKVEEVIDKLDGRYRQHDEYHLLMTKLDISLPQPKIEEQTKNQSERSNRYSARTVSRQELLAHLSSSTKLNSTYLLMLLLSIAVAVVGLMNNNVAVVIAAMVIAPLLGPNITLALATCTVDLDLAKRAVVVGSVGAGLALMIAIALGYFFPAEIFNSTEILNRTQINYGDFILALAAGAAGTLAFTTGGSGTLIGVMVAVALLPPLLVFGLKLGSGDFQQAFGAGLLYTVNFLGVNLAAVLTFLFQGIRPQTWWQADKAKKATIIAVVIWSSLLTAILILGSSA